MKKITEITTEREFVSKLRTYYRKARRKGYQRNEISFLGLMEYTGSATREFEYQSDKYFSVGMRAYDWQHGNSLLSALIDKWENEIEAEKRKKQPTQPSETPQISTETADTFTVSAEGEKEAERAEITSKAKRMKSKDDIAEQLERIRVTFLSLPDWDLEPRVGRMALAEDICKRYLENINQHLGLYDETEFCRYSDLKIQQSVYAAPQSPETPLAVECITEPCKLAQTA